jgi:hypothetical protein
MDPISTLGVVNLIVWCDPYEYLAIEIPDTFIGNSSHERVEIFF